MMFLKISVDVLNQFKIFKKKTAWGKHSLFKNKDFPKAIMTRASQNYGNTKTIHINEV